VTGARSVRPSRGRRFVKTCACDRGGFLRTRSPGRCSKAANRRRASKGAATSGWFPDPAWCWHSFAERKPSVGSSALPAGSHLVHGRLPDGSSSEPHRGVDARESAEARACCVRSVSGKDDGWTSVEPTCGACSRARAAYSRGTSCVPLQSAPDSARLSRAVHSLRWLRSQAGSVSYPLSPVGSRKNLSHTGYSPACLQLASIIRVPHGCKTPERGLKTRAFRIPLVVIAVIRSAMSADLDRARRMPPSAVAVQAALEGVFSQAL
jgi:hypothetical protein